MTPRAISALCGLALVAALCASAARSASPRTPSVQAGCVPYIVIDTRGSGEPQGTLSPPGQHFVTEWKKLHPGATVIVIKNPYPAAGAFTFLGAVLKVPGSYHNSVVAGKKWLEDALAGFAHCSSSTSILLIGYSQGAQVTADVVQAMSPSHVLGVALFGDPYFNSKDSVDRGGFQIGRNGFLGKRPQFSAYWKPHTLSYCHLHDPVCQGPLHNVSYLFSQHKTYNKLGDPEKAASYFFNLEQRTGNNSGRHVYWVNFTDQTTASGTVNKVPVGGGSVTTLASGQIAPASVAVDGKYVYWVNFNPFTGTVNKVPLDGGSVTTLATGQDLPYSVAVDGTHVYWVNSGWDLDTGWVNKVPLGGGSVTTLASSQDHPTSVAVDGTYVYWTNDNGGTVNKIPLGGGSVTTLASGQNTPESVAVDGTHVYWVNYYGGTVDKVPVGGGSVTTLASGQSTPINSVAVDGTYLYWVNMHDGTVNKVPLGGGSVTTLASGQDHPTTLAVDGTYVYWVNLGISEGLGTVNKVPAGGGSVTTLAAGQDNPTSIAVGP